VAASIQRSTRRALGGNRFCWNGLPLWIDRVVRLLQVRLIDVIAVGPDAFSPYHALVTAADSKQHSTSRDKDGSVPDDKGET
jgi:hypothetical protein